MQRMGRYAEWGNRMNRTLNLLNAFGFQGGTIHQVAALTGCDAFDLLHTEEIPFDMDRGRGWFAYRTNKQNYNKEEVTPKEQGNVQFWLGVAEAVEVTRKLGGKVVAKF